MTSEPSGPKKNAEVGKAYSRIGEQSDEQLREIIANTYGQIALDEPASLSPRALSVTEEVPRPIRKTWPQTALPGD